jgi:hypothetical protein
LNAPNRFNLPQPAPTAGDGAEVWPAITEAPGLVLPDWLREDMRERDRVGRERYGTPLRVWNGRDAVVDAYQEALDLVVYTKQARMRLGPPGFLISPLYRSAAFSLDAAVHHALQVAITLGELARGARGAPVPTTHGELEHRRSS